MKKSCSFLRDHATIVIDFEKNNVTANKKESQNYTKMQWHVIFVEKASQKSLLKI